MRIKILNFKVIETYTMRDTHFKNLWKWIFGKPDPDEYHFDILITLNTEYYVGTRKLEKNDWLELPNKVKLMVWDVDRNKINVKTVKFTVEDMRNYHPIEMYLCYPNKHGLITDRNEPRL